MPRSPQNLILVLFIAFLTACGGGEPETAAPDIDAFLKNAVDFRDQGQYRSAMIEARRAIQTAPDDPRGYTALGETLLEVGQTREAQALLEDVAIDDPELKLLLARAYLGSGKFRSARRLVDEHGDAMDAAFPDETGLLRANLLLAEGELDDARSAYDALADSSVANEAKLGLVRVAVAYESFDRALELVDEIIATDPANLGAVLLGGQIEAARGDYAAAEAYLVDGVSTVGGGDIMTPERYAIVAALRDVLTAQGKTSEALIYSQLLAESMPDGQEITEKIQAAMEAMSAGNFEEARAILTEVRELAPASREVGTLLGTLEFLEGNTDAAADYFEQYVDPEVATPTMLQIYTLTELRLNRPQRIIEQLQADVDESTDARVVSLFGIAQASAGNYEAAEKYFRRAISLGDSDPRLRIPLVRLYNLQERNEEALAELESAYDESPDAVAVQAAMLRQFMVMDLNERADEFAATLRKEFPDNQDSLLLTAEYYMARGDFPEARKVLTDELENSYRRLMLLGQLDLREENWVSAEVWYREATELDPDATEAWKGLVSAGEARGEPDSPLKELKAAAETGSSLAPTLVLVEYYARNANFSEARTWLETIDPEAQEYQQFDRLVNLTESRQALEDDDYDRARALLVGELEKSPDEADLLAQLVNIELQAEQFEEARKVLDRLADEEPDAVRVVLLEGELELRQGNLDAALERFAEAWEVAPTEQLAVRRYQTLLRMPEQDEARFDALFVEWNDFAPESVTRQVLVAGHYLNRNRQDEARTMYEALIATNPNVPIAFNNLAWIYGEDEIDKAVEVSARAYELAPQSGEIADTYGWFLYLKGDTEQAQQLLARAVELAPDNEEIKSHYRIAMGEESEGESGR